jgi:hypothetical protein
MLHVSLYTICFVFCYTSWHFYAFFGTNLLTRCHSASSLFSAILCFRKATQEIFSELDETKAKPPIFTEASRRPKMRRRGARGQAHHGVARPSPWPRHHMVRPAGPPPDAALSPINSPRREKPKRTNHFSSKHTASRRRRQSEIGRIQELFPAPCRREESLSEAFSTTMVTSGVMCE